METGTENAAASEIDELHAAVTQQAASPEAELVETAGDPAAGTQPDGDSDAAFCERILSLCLARHSRSVRAEYLRVLEPVCERDQAERIAEQAAMDPELQAAIAEHGARVLKKYGAAKFLSDEAILIGSLIAYGWQRSEARRERDELLERLKPAPKAVEQPPAT